jgi:hypothetical protein
MSSLLKEIRKLGYEIHFAGIDLSEEEKQGLGDYIDRWVHHFSTHDSGAWFAKIRRRLHFLYRQLLFGKYGGRRHCYHPIDAWFNPAWLPAAKRLQKQECYGRVLVAYVYHSAFLKAFPRACIKILDCHDKFANRNTLLQQLGLSSKDFWFSTDTAGERSGLNRADIILAIQKDEASYFTRLTGGRRQVHLVGHIIDPQPLSFGTETTTCLGYLASDIPINVRSMLWFLDEVWSVVHRCRPRARLLVAGGISGRLSPAEGMELIGPVETAESLYTRILFGVNPMLAGTGLKIKTLEGLAYGRAVVATASGCDGLEDFIGNGLTLTRSAEEYVNALVTRLDAPATTMAEGGAAIACLNRFNRDSREQLAQALVRAHPGHPPKGSTPADATPHNR